MPPPVTESAPGGLRGDANAMLGWLLALRRPHCTGCASTEKVFGTGHLLYDRGEEHYLVLWGCTACGTRFCTVHDEIPWAVRTTP